MEVEQTKYIRDKNSKSIFQSDRIALDNYRMAKKQKESEINVINTLVNDVEELKNTIRQLQNDNKKRK